LIGLPTVSLSGFFDAVSSNGDRESPFLAFYPNLSFFFWSSFELELLLSSDSEEEATLSPELLLDRYLLLLALDRLVLLRSEAAGFEVFKDEEFLVGAAVMRPRALWKNPPFCFFSSIGGIIAEISSALRTCGGGTT
jgi:hypothetical protein